MHYFIRHGLDDERFIGGHSDVPLTDTGILQVEKAIEFIKKNNIIISKIYSSDVYRAQQTAEMISKEIGVPTVLEPRLKEQDKGSINGVPLEEAMQIFPLHFGNIKIKDTYPEGESYLDMYQRIVSLLEHFHFEDNSLLVTHRGPINCCYFYCNNQYPDMNKKQFQVTHASIHRFDRKNKLIKKLY